jgi:mono/diheme cytochrome c family protein
MRLLGRALVGFVGLFLVLGLLLYGASEWMIRRSHAVPLTNLAIPKDAASIAEGARLARIMGCRGCHGSEAQGAVWNDPPWFVASVVAPSIARKTAPYSEAELVRLIRHGVRKDGSTLFIMPTISHRYLADDDTARIVAWIRTLKPTPKDALAETSFGPLGRWLMLSGQMRQSVQAGNYGTAHRPADVGRYYYQTVCSECHKLDRPNRSEDGGQMVPALAPMAAGYDPAAFHKLMKTGIGMSGRDLGLMKMVAQEAASAFTPQEVDAIQAYLKGEAEKTPAQ